MQMTTYLRHVDKYPDARKHVLNIEAVTVERRIELADCETC